MDNNYKPAKCCDNCKYFVSTAVTRGRCKYNDKRNIALTSHVCDNFDGDSFYKGDKIVYENM